jgi:hypothetical protein
MRYLAWLLALVVVVGCKKEDKLGPPPVCDSYLACLSATSPSEFTSALPLYGPNGSCWQAANTAASCEVACREALKSLAAAHPGKAECQGSGAGDGGVGDGPRPDARPRPDWGPLPQVAEVDILFMVDNSNSMEEEQINLTQNFGRLIDALRSPKLGGPGCSPTNRQACKLPNLRIGVISSDLGAGGD